MSWLGLQFLMKHQGWRLTRISCVCVGLINTHISQNGLQGTIGSEARRGIFLSYYGPHLALTQIVSSKILIKNL